MVDLSNPDAVIAEAARRAQRRRAGEPLLDGGGVARDFLQSPKKQEARRDPGSGRTPSQQAKALVMLQKLADVAIGDPPLAWRRGDTLWLSIPATARSKKNSTMLGIKKSPAYTRFRNQVVAVVTPFTGQLRLPLPDLDYNCAALFYMEREVADTDNLISGLADALQDAGVLADDFRIRTWNGTDRFVDAARPRIDVTLTPYLGAHR